MLLLESSISSLCRGAAPLIYPYYEVPDDLTDTGTKVLFYGQCNDHYRFRLGNLYTFRRGRNNKKIHYRHFGKDYSIQMEKIEEGVVLTPKQNKDFLKSIKATSVVIPGRTWVKVQSDEVLLLKENMYGHVSIVPELQGLGFIYHSAILETGYSGYVTLELFNTNDVPVELISGSGLACLYIHSLE